MDILEQYSKAKISAVVRTNDADVSLKIARAIISGGINLVEITVGKPEMYGVIKELSDSTDALIVAGGVITSRQAQESLRYGAKAIVSPIYQPGLIKLCQAKNVPVITTATTPNEAYQAWKAGVQLIKIFPTEQMGGASYIEDLLRHMPFLNVIATGNVKLNNFEEYLKVGAVAVTVGRDFWLNADENEIASRAKSASEKVKLL